MWRHFFFAAAAVFLLALFRPSYCGYLAGTDEFLLLRLLISGFPCAVWVVPQAGAKT
jgi:hypothetical protein